VLIRRFGPGARGTTTTGRPGPETAAFWRDDERGVLLTEIYLDAGTAIAATSSPNHCVFWVVDGVGEVRVGGESAKVQAGEAVHWPPGVEHAVQAAGAPLRAFILEYGAVRSQERDLAD